jgi:hypothetical protein
MLTAACPQIEQMGPDCLIRRQKTFGSVQNASEWCQKANIYLLLSGWGLRQSRTSSSCSLTTLCSACRRRSCPEQFRLLACLVADVMTADTPLDRSLAETVGKHLARQADSVRG